MDHDWSCDSPRQFDEYEDDSGQEWRSGGKDIKKRKKKRRTAGAARAASTHRSTR